MRKFREKAKWKLFDFLAKRKTTCVVDSYEVTIGKGMSVRDFINSNQVLHCAEDMQNTGSCYCGKFSKEPKVPTRSRLR